MKKFFNPKPTTCEELKRAYRELTLEYHPDATGRDTNAEMAQINEEYKALFPKLKDIHTTLKGETYEKENPETPEAFIELINELIKYEGTLIEILGSFVWVTGQTKPYKDLLKDLGFKYAPKKQAWYLAPADYHKQSKRHYSLEEIRSKYYTGFEYEAEERVKISA